MQIVNFLKTIFVLSLSIFLASNSIAFADTLATLSGEISWSQPFWSTSGTLSIYGDQGSPSPYFDNQATQSSGAVYAGWTQKDNKNKTVGNWSDTYSLNLSYSGNEGSAASSSSASSSMTSSFSNINAVSGTLRTGSSITRGAFFWAQGDGTITFNLPYSAVFDLQKASESDWVKAYVIPFINIQKYVSKSEETGVGISFDRSDYYFNGYSVILDGSALSASERYSGTVSLSLPFVDGERAEFFFSIRTFVEAYSSEASAVPEPATMLLLGFGIVGLAGVRRFRK